MIGDPLAVDVAQHELPLCSQEGLLYRVQEVLHGHVRSATSRGPERSLVREVAQVGADKARRLARDLVEVDVRRERDVAGVDAQDRCAPPAIRRLHLDAAVEASRPQQGGIQHICAVGGGEHDHALARVEAVHLSQDLVERLLLLVVAANPQRRRAAPTNRVELVDEDDRGRRRACLGEQVADPRCADADDGFDEFRRRDAEERNLGLARHRARKQRLTCTGRADEQYSFRHGSTEALVLLGIAQEVDDLLEVRLHLVDPGHVVESDRRPLRVVETSPALAEAAEDASRARCGRAPRQIEEEEHERDRGPEAEEK